MGRRGGQQPLPTQRPRVAEESAASPRHCCVRTAPANSGFAAYTALCTKPETVVFKETAAGKTEHAKGMTRRLRRLQLPQRPLPLRHFPLFDSRKPQHPPKLHAHTGKTTPATTKRPKSALEGTPGTRTATECDKQQRGSGGGAGRPSRRPAARTHPQKRQQRAGWPGTEPPPDTAPGATPLRGCAALWEPCVEGPNGTPRCTRQQLFRLNGL